MVGLFTSILDSGGIQRASQQVAAVLSELSQQQDRPYHLLSLNDRAGYHQIVFDGHSFTVRGFERNKKSFALAALRMTLKNDLVYIAHPNLAPIGLLLKFLRPGARYIVAAHGTDVWEPLSQVRRWGLQNATLVTAPSTFTAKAMIRSQRLLPTRVTVVPWAIEPKLIKRNGTRHQLPLRPNGKILLTVGRMDASERLKGVEEVLRALSSVLEKFPDTYYVIVGEGDDSSRLQSLAEQLKLASHVLFVGRTSDAELTAYYEACDVFVMPSRQEGFGLVFLEAMAFGKPVIGGNHGGTPDVVQDQVTGFLVQHGDVETLSLRLASLLGDSELRNRMGEAGRRRVNENYTFDKFRDGFIGLLSAKGLLNSVAP